MGKFSLYTVPLSENASNIQEFEYILDDKFFSLIEDTVEIKKGNLKANLVLKHMAREFELLFHIEGTVKVPCDRCLDDVTMDILTDNKLVVKCGEDYSDESDEIVVIPQGESSINVAWFLFEFVALSLPMKHVHAPGTCNKAMSAKYNKHKADYVEDADDDDNEEVEAEEDSRWDALKDLSFDESAE